MTSKFIVAKIQNFYENHKSSLSKLYELFRKFVVMKQGSIIIADAGGTKTDWIAIESGGGEINRVQTGGINAVTMHIEKIRESVCSASRLLNSEDVRSIFFYGAGCGSAENCKRIAEELLHEWPDAKIDVASDMLATARSLWGAGAGVACILGTGANSALYDGKEIIDNTPPMGFILGDEGSGAAIGKRFLSDVFKKVAPVAVIELFQKEIGWSIQDVIAETYRGTTPAKFLASILPFLHANISESYIKLLIVSEFKLFFQRNVLRYANIENLEVSFVGSVAYYFADLLKEAATECSLKIGRIEQSPLEGLIKYHIANGI